MIKTTQFIFTIVFTVLLMGSCAEKTKTPQQPNIVFILCDDLGFGDVHTMAPDYCKIPTPNMDKLATEGMTFMDAHSGSSVCTPTRYGLLTGRYAWRSRLQHGVVQATEKPLIDADRLTVASYLRNQGYQTGMVGKWHLNYTYHNPETDERLMPTNKNKTAGVPVGTIIPDGPISRGFDYFFGYHHAGSMKTVVENDKVIKEIKLEEMLPLLTQKAVGYINQKAGDAKNGKPFFLYVPLSAPHGPIVPTKEWIGKSGLGLYGDFVMQTDWSVGQIINAIDKNGLTQNTLLIVTSDNGASPIADFPALEKQGHYPSAYLRGTKADAWDGGHRVPFIVRWPAGHVAAGSKCNQLACLTDFMPTCAEILGDKLPEDVAEDGVSFLPALHGEKIADERAAVVHHSISGKFAIRKGKWKLILCPGSGGWSKPKDNEATKMGLPDIQLYDMDADVGEEHNLYKEHPEIVKELTSLLEEYVSDGRSTPGEKLLNDVDVDIWKLKK